MNTKILIIDDSDFDQTLLGLLLEKQGYLPSFLANGKDVIEVIKSECPEVVILDLLLPDTNGLDLLKLIREAYTPLDLPVIIISSQNENQTTARALYNGANDYITKPINIDITILRIKNLLFIKELARESSRLKELAAINALVVTYNHEINNPLTSAIGMVDFLKEQYSDQKEFVAIEESLWKIGKLIKEISNLLQSPKIEYKKYLNESMMLKLKPDPDEKEE